MVGGPVQADRPCYIKRPADDQLLDAIADEQFAFVLAPHGSGKSSLMGRAIRRLRADGQLAAVVDLNQIASRGEQVDSARWHYSVAYRICRELRLKVDLQHWWQDKSMLVNEQRLAEFFQDVVLANTSSSVTVFIDEAERAISLPFAQELFAALHSCYMRRVSEPDFARLNFVVIGAAMPFQLCPDPGISPFATGREIVLNDFTPEQCLELAPGMENPDAPGLLAQVYRWTRGQPYLTQKLARGIARRGKPGIDIEAVANELLLAPGVAREEPLLSQVRASLKGDAPRYRQASAILQRLARGQEVIDDPRSVAQGLLRLAGITSSDDNGMLHFRNRIVERVFGRDRLPPMHASPWFRPAAIGASAALVVVVAWFAWFRIMPAPNIGILEASADIAQIEQAHAELAGLPGHKGSADRLFADALERLGRVVQSRQDLARITSSLVELPGGEVTAQRLTAAFWWRRATAAAARSERDIALTHALAASEAGSSEAAVLAGNLISEDYRKLQRSMALELPPLALAADWQRGRLVVVDTDRKVHQLPLQPGSVGLGNSTVDGLSLSALQHVGVSVGSFVDEPGTAGAFELWVELDHQRSSDLLLRLTAPGGVETEIALPDSPAEAGRFEFSGADGQALSALARESITGRWELALFDRRTGFSGRLLGWGLRFPGIDRDWDESLVAGLELPDPERVEQARVRLSRKGDFAAVLPQSEDARGAVSVWDLVNGRLLTDLPLTSPARYVRWLGTDRLLVVGNQQAQLWNIPDNSVVRSFDSVGGFEIEPAITPDGTQFALAETINAGRRVSLFDAATGSRRGLYESESWSDWILGPNARFAVKVDGSRRGRVVDPRTGMVITDFYHEHELTGLLRSDSPDRVIAIDQDGGVFRWSLADGRAMLSPLESRYLGSTHSLDAASVSSDDSALAVAGANGLVTVIDPASSQGIAQLSHSGSGDTKVLLSPVGEKLVSVSDDLVRIWQLDVGRTGFGPSPDVTAVAVSAEHQLTVLGNRHGQLRFLQDARTLNTGVGAVEAVSAHKGAITSIAISASGSRAASGGSDGTIQVWDLATTEPLPVVMSPTSGPVRALAISPDNRWLISAGADVFRISDLSTGRLVRQIEVEGKPRVVAFSPNGALAAAGDSDGTIVLVEPDSDAPPVRLRRNGALTALRFAAQSALLAAGTENGELVFLDTRSGAVTDSSVNFAEPIHRIALSPEAGQVQVQSGAWLHTVLRDQEPSRIVSSRLLPEFQRSALSWVSLTAADARLFGVPLNAAAGPIPDRDWPAVLGLRFDPETGAVTRILR